MSTDIFTIVLICGSIEPMRDGVGDYTRRLAGALIRSGEKVAILAVHDKYVSERENSKSSNHIEHRYQNWPIEQIQTDEGLAISVYRWPALQRWTKKRTQIERLLALLNPATISVQFVAYAFQAQGLFSSFSGLLVSIRRKQQFKLHIMLHELWVGISKKSSLKNKAVGYIQRRLLLDLLRKAAPDAVSTTTSGYAQTLGSAGIASLLLPVFSNIPMLNRNSVAVPSGIQKCEAVVGNRTDWLSSEPIRIGTFGSWDRGHPNHLTFTLLNTKLGIADLRAKIIAIGQSQPPDWVEEGSKDWDRLSFTYTTKLSAPEVDRVISSCDMGLVTTDILSIQKSGSSAAFLERQKLLLTSESLISAAANDYRDFMISLSDAEKIDFHARAGAALDRLSDAKELLLSLREHDASQ